MKIYIELLVIAVLCFVGLFWYLWDTWSKKRILKKYNPNENKSRKPGDFEPTALGNREPAVEKPVEANGRLPEPERRELLQVSDASDDGKAGNGNRKNGSSIRRLLNRRKKE